MGDTRSDFGEFYPGGGAAVQGYGEAPVAVDAVARGKIAAAAAAIGTLEGDGPESLGDVKERLAAAAAALA